MAKNNTPKQSAAERQARYNRRFGGPLGLLLNALVEAAYQAGSLSDHWRQVGDADLDSLASFAERVRKAVAEARGRAMEAIEDHGVTQLLVPWRGESVEAWLLRMLSLFDELREAAHSCVIKVPDRARLNRLPEIFTEMYLAHLHVDNILALRASDVSAQAAAPKQPQPPQDDTDIDDDLFPDEIDDDERYPHSYWNLPDAAANELANLIIKALGQLMEIGRLWPRAYASDALVAREKREHSDEEKEVLGAMFKAWIDFQGNQGAIQKCIQAGAAQRAGEAWAKEVFDALDTAHREFNANPIDPTTSDEALRDGLRMELARPKRFVKLADRLYKAYRELAYAYIVPEGKPAAPVQSEPNAPAVPTAATTASPQAADDQPRPRMKPRRGRLMVKERMEATLIKKPEALGWTITEWQKELKCSRGVVQKTETWERLHAQHRLEQAHAALSKSPSKRRKRKAR